MSRWDTVHRHAGFSPSATAPLPACRLAVIGGWELCHDAVMEASGEFEELCRSPVFILTASRSGSTLLRSILDSHPGLRLACPPETTVSGACAQLIRTWDMVENAGYQSRPVTETSTPSAEALQARGRP